jgi:tRNA-dihydrouridine synthase
MIGRAPWIFAHLDRVQVSAEMLQQMVHRHLKRSMAFYGEYKGLILFCRHALLYLKFTNMPRVVRTRIIAQKDAGNFLTMLDAYYARFAAL